MQSYCQTSVILSVLWHYVVRANWDRVTLGTTFKVSMALAVTFPLVMSYFRAVWPCTAMPVMCLSSQDDSRRHTPKSYQEEVGCRLHKQMINIWGDRRVSPALNRIYCMCIKIPHGNLLMNICNIYIFYASVKNK